MKKFSDVYPTLIFNLIDLFTKIQLHFFFSFSYLEKSFIFNPPNFVLLMVEIKIFNVFCLQIVSVAFLRHFKFIFGEFGMI